MSRELRRSILQIVLIALMLLGILGGLGCNSELGCYLLLLSLSCNSGSTHEAHGDLALARQHAAVAQGSGLVDNWHDFAISDVTLLDKDLSQFRQWASEHSLVIGLQVPRAPGAAEPGTLAPITHQVHVRHDGGPYTPVDLAASGTHAAQIAAVLPPDPDTAWQALVPADDSWLALLPTETTTFRDISGSLYYRLDFGGEDPCAGCQVKLTFCTDETFSPIQRLQARAFLQRTLYSDGSLTCTEPMPSYLVLSDLGQPVPGMPFVAAFGLYGGNIISGTMESTIEIPYRLEHTSPTAQTFDLEPIASERGWTYEWTTPDGQPVDRIQVGPLPDPLWLSAPPNIHVVGSGLPQCAHLLDTIALTATHVTTPTIQATALTHVQIYPDPQTCPSADVGISQVASHQVITGGQQVTFTLSITNYETVAVTTQVTETLSPASAIEGTTLPPGCAGQRSEITCPSVDLAAGESQALLVGVQTRSTFGGILSSWAQAWPTGAADVRYYDNDAGPVEVTVNRGQGGWLALPLLLRASQ